MLLRLAIAAFLTVAAASGCTSIEDNTISLVAEKPVLSRWPLKRSTPPAPRVDRPAAAPPARKAEAASAAGAQKFLDSLPPDLREQVESETAGATPEERLRLLNYLATVDPAKIPALLDARKAQRTARAPEPAASPVVPAVAVERPTFELTTDEAPSPQVTPASAQGGRRAADLFNSAPSAQVPSAQVPSAQGQPAPAAAEPVARPRRNPLIEIQGVEFEEQASAGEPKVTPAADQALETPPGPGPAAEPAGPASAVPSTNPLTKLKEWTTIRKPDPPAPQPVQTAQASLDPLSLQGISRRLRGPKAETPGLPLDDITPVAGESPHLHEGIQRLIALMETETARLKPGTSFAQREEYVRRHAELRMLLLMSRQPMLALQAIPEIDPETQEFWTSMMWAMSSYFDNQSIVDPAERAAVALDRLRAAEQHLQTTARLELRSLAFCDKIDGFGAYHPFEQAVFRAGQPVLLYAEVRNFKTEVTPAGRYRALLKSTIEIVKAGEDTELVERRHFDSTEDQSRSPRMDYFHSYKLDLPLHLTPGTYVLKLTLEDELSGKVGASTIEFLVR